ncbi:MAG: ImmA/IrrE family metallo-endopeptidase [Bacillota bacterium]
MLSFAAIAARRLIGQAQLSVPVDPWEAARTLGLRVEMLPLESVDGFLRRPPGCDWYVIISSLLPRQRQRFTLAHEIGHWMLHRNDQEYFAHRPGSRGRYEREANQFAAELLMPFPALQKAAGQMAFGELAAHFEVSREALAIRLEETGLYWLQEFRDAPSA